VRINRQRMLPMLQPSVLGKWPMMPPSMMMPMFYDPALLMASHLHPAFWMNRFQPAQPQHAVNKTRIASNQQRNREPSPVKTPVRRAPPTSPVENKAGGQKTYACPHCDKVFNAHYNLTRHMPVHTGARPFVCKVCGKGFRQASTLCRHKIIHTSEKPHKCTTCNKAFNR